jgi:hypothetical protein
MSASTAMFIGNNRFYNNGPLRARPINFVEEPPAPEPEPEPDDPKALPRYMKAKRRVRPAN